MLSRTSHPHSAITLHLNWRCKHDAPQLMGHERSEGAPEGDGNGEAR